MIDINETLGNGSPNPNVGRLMMIATRGQAFPRIPGILNGTETATAFYEIDFQDEKEL